jgi:hypothetical protein
MATPLRAELALLLGAAAQTAYAAGVATGCANTAAACQSVQRAFGANGVHYTVVAAS